MKTDSSRTARWLTLLVAVTVVAWGQTQAMGQQRRNQSYYIMHNFSWQPATPSTTYTVDWYHFEHAAAWDGTTSLVSVNPSPQNIGFNGLFGHDWLTPQGVAWNSGMTVPVQIVEANTFLGGVTPPAGGTSTQNAILTSATATATSAWSITSMSSSGVGATNMTSGSAWTTGSHSNIAYAYSESRLVIVDNPAGMTSTGRVDWTPRWSDSIGLGSAMAWDPVHFTFHDAGGAVILEDTPIIIEGCLEEGELEESSLGWDEGYLFAEGVLEGTITGVVESQYINAGQQGSFEVTIHEGLVTVSEATGIFAAYTLPLVGSPGTFNVSFLPTIGIDYNYPAATTMNLSLGGAGSGAPVPEPGTLALLILGGLGMLGYVVRPRK